MQSVLVRLRHSTSLFLGFICFTAIVMLGNGCATAVRSDFLSGKQQLQKGKYVESYWSDGDISKGTLARIYLAPVDVSRIQDRPGVTTKEASECLRLAAISSLQSQGWSLEEQPDAATATLALAITYLTPGSASGRIWAAELGVGHAFVQVEGKLIDAVTGKEIACFADRRRDSGAIGFEDVGGDAGPKMVKHMLGAIPKDFTKELSASLK